ncbi:MAG: hypothetical protein CVT84_18620, partial [Alphaproteobacteria bacterium HGW-Alphaproteobacteria-6]
MAIMARMPIRPASGRKIWRCRLAAVLVVLAGAVIAGMGGWRGGRRRGGGSQTRCHGGGDDEKDAQERDTHADQQHLSEAGHSAVGGEEEGAEAADGGDGAVDDSPGGPGSEQVVKRISQVQGAMEEVDAAVDPDAHEQGEG